LFVVSLIIVGLSVFATITASVVGPALSGELARLFRPEEKKLKPKNHVILAGDGPLATNAARELVAKGISSVAIVSETPDFSDPSQQVITGNACEESVLREAGIATARLVIAARDDDGENAFIALVSKDINPEVSVLAIASSAKAIPRLKLARADLVFAPHVLGGRLLVDLATGKELSAEQRELLEGTES
jgi:voltage-gated potassium channel